MADYPTINSSTYAGKHAGAYIAAALKQASTLEFVTVRENVDYKEVVTKLTGANLVADRSCDFTKAGSLTTDEVILYVEPFQINMDICKSVLLSDWNGEMQDDFVAYSASYLASSIADSAEFSFWQGDTATSGQFNAISKTGMVSLDNEGGAGVAYSASNIIANLQALAAGIPANVYGKDDLYIYMNKKTYRYYISAISALGAFPFNHMGQYTPEFEGISIAVVDGMADNEMYAGQKSNIFFGTSLSSDLTSVKVMDMEDIDGSDNIRLVAKWTAGCTVGVAGDWTVID